MLGQDVVVGDGQLAAYYPLDPDWCCVCHDHRLLQVCIVVWCASYCQLGVAAGKESKVDNAWVVMTKNGGLESVTLNFFEKT